MGKSRGGRGSLCFLTDARGSPITSKYKAKREREVTQLAEL